MNRADRPGCNLQLTGTMWGCQVVLHHARIDVFVIKLNVPPNQEDGSQAFGPSSD